MTAPKEQCATHGEEPTEQVIVAMADCLLKTHNCVTREEIIAAWRVAQPSRTPIELGAALKAKLDETSVSETVPIRACLQWCVDHDGECLGDHQSILASCIEALKNAPSLQEQADDELRMRLDHPPLSRACPICGHDQPHEHHWPWALSSVETPVSATREKTPSCQGCGQSLSYYCPRCVGGAGSGRA